MITKENIHIISTIEFLNRFSNSDYQINNKAIEESIDALKNNIASGKKENYLALNDDDIYSILEDSDELFILSYEAKSIDNAIEDISESFLMKRSKTTKEILIHFETYSNYDVMPISQYMNMIHDLINEDASVGFCISPNDSMSNEEMKIILIASC